MTCPGAEHLSRWADGTLDSREAAVVARHAETCAACRRKAEELRAAGAWVASVGTPGPSCLSAEAMAAALESGRAPAHVRTCPRCAAEYRSLRGVERRVTHRISRPPTPMMGWAAAAAVFIAVALLLVLANRQEPTQPRERIVYQEQTPAVERQDPAPTPVPAPLPKSTVDEPFKVPHFPQPRPTPPAPEPPPTPPAPVVAEATPDAPKPRTPDAPRPVEVVEAAKPPTALSVKYGSLTANFDGKWVKPQRIDDGMVLRAEGRTQLDFAQARITLDGTSKFTVSKNEFALTEGAMSAEVGAGSKFTLLLDEQRFVPQTFNARVLFCARPDRIVVEEGSAKWKDTFLHEGVEHSVKKDGVTAQKRRTLPAAFRARETLTWRMDLTKNDAVKRHVFVGRVETLPEGKVLASEPLKDGYFYGQAACANGGDELYNVKPNTAIRFRYFLKEPAILELVTWNYTKGENFNKPLEPVLRQWTTVTVFARDIPANQGGKKVTCEVGDRYTSLGLFVGKPETASEVLIDRLEILEIDR